MFITFAFCLLPFAFPAPLLGQTAPAEVVAELRVHGNQILTNDEVIALSGLKIGSPVTETTIPEVTKRLRDSKKFQDVQVLKRFASISDPSKIVIVMIVSEGPVDVKMPKGDGEPRIVKKGGPSNLMWFPLLDGEDGYALTFGVKFAVVNAGSPDAKISFPLTWGGTRQAAAEYDRTFKNGPFSRIQFGAGIDSRKNPAFEIVDTRRRVQARGERAFGPLRLGAEGTLQHVSFGGAEDDFRTIGGDVAFDTRSDPLLPRNAVYAIASWEHVTYANGPSEPGIARVINRVRLEGHGWIGFIGQTVLEFRAIREDADRPLPAYMQSLLGGWRTLRGFEAGSFFGDTLVTGSAELRIPLTTPLSVGKIGVSAFVDRGTVYPNGQQLRNATFRTGFGGTVWFTAAVFQMSLAVAHGIGAGTRVNFMVGLSF